MARNIAIYSRKSKFTGKGESIENQIELCKQYIENNYGDDGPIEIFIYEDEGYSGKNTSRPQLKKMLQDAKKKIFTVLICYRLDRISRNVSDFANLIEELHRLGVDFVSIKEKFDTSNPIGRAMMYISSVFAQLERETIAERIRDNMYELSKTGRWLGGTTPTGYTSESIQKVSMDGKIKKACKLKIVPEEAQVIRTIYEKYLDTGSLTQTDAYLIQNNYKTKNNKYFTRFSIKSILENPVYAKADEDSYTYIIDHKMNLFSDKKEFDGYHGLMVYNRTQQKDGLAHKARAMEEWIVSVGKHEGLISGRDWVKVQKLLNINQSKAYKKPRSNVALLSGIMICGNCGEFMRPKLTRRSTVQGERIYEYLCYRKEKSKSECCNMKNLNGNMIDHTICDEIKKLSMDDSYFLKRMELLYKTISASKKDEASDQDRLKRLLKENEREMNALVNALAFAAGQTAQQYIMKQIDECHYIGERLREHLKETEDLASEVALTIEEFDRVKRSLLDFGYHLTKATVEQKRNAIRSIVSKVVWDGKDIHLFLIHSDDEEGMNSHSSEPLCEDSKCNTILVAQISNLIILYSVHDTNRVMI
jgi:DNA invertase Pin-like site-specific DNA recombinase